MNGLFARAVIAFLVLPGVVAFLAPLLFFAPADRTSLSNWWGVVPLGDANLRGRLGSLPETGSAMAVVKSQDRLDTLGSLLFG